MVGDAASGGRGDGLARAEVSHVARMRAAGDLETNAVAALEAVRARPELDRDAPTTRDHCGSFGRHDVTHARASSISLDANTLTSPGIAQLRAWIARLSQSASPTTDALPMAKPSETELGVFPRSAGCELREFGTKHIEQPDLPVAGSGRSRFDRRYQDLLVVVCRDLLMGLDADNRCWKVSNGSKHDIASRDSWTTQCRSIWRHATGQTSASGNLRHSAMRCERSASGTPGTSFRSSMSISPPTMSVLLRAVGEFCPRARRSVPAPRSLTTARPRLGCGVCHAARALQGSRSRARDARRTSRAGLVTDRSPSVMGPTGRWRLSVGWFDV